MLGLKSVIFGGSEDEAEEERITEDQHEDENAEVGDRRVKVVPRGEVFGYDSHVSGEFLIERQVYAESATYQSGCKHYSWRSEDSLFRGTPKEWRSVKDNPSKIMRDIPHNWDDIVQHTDSFLDVHEEYLDNKNQPNTILNM